MKPIIRFFHTANLAATIDLILSIQQQEFGVQINAKDQPDLQEIPHYYQQGNGQFWVAEMAGQLVGTLALVDIGRQQVALRKMFVDSTWRGPEHRVAERLLKTAIQWCVSRKVTDVYLGTIHVYHAAIRFYEKHGFERIEKQHLPSDFPLIAVDDLFFRKSLDTN